LSQLHANSKLISEAYADDGVRVEVEAPLSLVQKLHQYQVS